MKDSAIVPLATQLIDTFDGYYEVDAPNLISPDHGSNDKSMIDDDYKC